MRSCRDKDIDRLQYALEQNESPLTIAQAARDINRGVSYVHSLVLACPGWFSIEPHGRRVGDAVIDIIDRDGDL